MLSLQEIDDELALLLQQRHDVVEEARFKVAQVDGAIQVVRQLREKATANVTEEPRAGGAGVISK